MSAAVRARSKKRVVVAIKGGYAKIPQYLLLGAAKHVGETAWLVYGLFLDTAARMNTEWVELSAEELTGPTNVTARFVEQAFAELLSADVGWLERRPSRMRNIAGRMVRGWEYRSLIPSQSAAADSDTLYGVCDHCGQTCVMERHTGFCPTPHAYWRKLGACLANSSHRVLGVIMAHTLGWNEQRCVLTVDDIMRDSGLGRRTVQEAIADLLAKGLIGREAHGPHALFSTALSNCIEYWVNVDRFGELKPLPKRKIARGVRSAGKAIAPSATFEGPDEDPEPDDDEDDDEYEPAAGYARMDSGPRSRLRMGPGGRDGGEQAAMPSGGSGCEMVEETTIQPPSRAAQYVTTPITRCRNCGDVGPHKLLASEVGALTSQFTSQTGGAAGGEARAGPPKEPPRIQKSGGPAVMTAELRPLLEYLMAEWFPRTGRKPDAAVTREIHVAMAGAPVSMLHGDCARREEYIRRSEYPYKVIATIAHEDTAPAWELSENARVESERKQAEWDASQPTAEEFERAIVEARERERAAEVERVEAQVREHARIKAAIAVMDIDTVRDALWGSRGAATPEARRNRGLLKARLKELEAG